jgi:MoaA/NifB/PqqE/SkfB family radical SAM enzyme
MSAGSDGSSRLRLDLKVGYSCNNRCVFCVQGDKRDRLSDRTTEELRELLSERRTQTDSVVLTGGEVTLREDLLELVRYARTLGYTTIQLQTNGRRLSYKPYVRALVAAGVTEVSPALHGSSPETHDRLTRSRGAFQQVVHGIENVRDAGLPVISNSVVVESNYREMPDLVRLLVRLRVSQLQLAYVHPAGTAGAQFDDVVPRFTDAIPFIHEAITVARQWRVRAYTEAIPYCFMAGYEEHIVEDHIPATWVEDGAKVIEDYTAYRWAEGKAKGPPCATCRRSSVCEGPWHEYPREFGWDEFHPITDSTPNQNPVTPQRNP